MLRHGQVQNNLEELHPGKQCIVLAQERAQLKLIGSVENLHDLMQNGLRHLVFGNILCVLIHDLLEHWADLRHDLDEGATTFVNFELVLLQQAVESNAASVDTTIVARLERVRDVLRDSGPLLWVIKAAYSDDATNILFLNGAVRAVVHL